MRKILASVIGTCVGFVVAMFMKVFAKGKGPQGGVYAVVPVYLAIAFTLKWLGLGPGPQ
jgi:hypothetical protein